MLSIGEKLTDLLPKQDFISGVADLNQTAQLFGRFVPFQTI